jgi:DNA polymerase-4
MPMSQALRLCPHATVCSGHFRDYRAYSRKVMAVLAEYTPLLEPVSIDEAFMDVTGCELLFGPPEQLAHQIQERIQSQLGLPSSLGVASNKLVAKVASDQAKPKGVLVVPPGAEASFLAPLDIECLWGVGEVTAGRLRSHGLNTIGQVAELSDSQLRAMFGSAAQEMRCRALGVDDRPVGPSGRRKSISQEHTFAEDVGDQQVLHRTVLSMSEDVAAQLRRKGLSARTVVLKLRYPDFRTISRRLTLPQPTDLAEIIQTHAEELLRRECKPDSRFRLIGVGVTGLVGARQLSLFASEERRLGKLSQVVDEIRRKHGRGAIRRASLLDSEDR